MAVVSSIFNVLLVLRDSVIVVTSGNGFVV
jgi:hypothetical protein